jgi:putative transposase
VTLRDSAQPRRQSIRLRGYDYAAMGAYFVTAVTQGRRCLFGAVRDGEVELSRFGQLVQQTWEGSPRHYPHVELDAFIVMPNHIHGVIFLLGDANPVGAGFKPALVLGGQTGPASTEAVHSTAKAGLKPAPTDAAATPKRHALPEIIRAFKTFSARAINQQLGSAGQPVWQRNYYEHVIRNDRSLEALRNYIESNPLKWAEDPENPALQGSKAETRQPR